MASLPYLQFYPADYLADTQHLTTEEHGAYFLLILNYWQTGKPLDNRKGRLATIARMSSERWANAEPTLSEFFTVEDNIWTHVRLEFDLDAVYQKSIKAAHSASAGARARASERLANAQQTLSHTDTDTDTDKSELAVPTELANFLADKIQENGSKRPEVTDAWITDIDRLIRLDKRSEVEVREMIEWSQQDSFWKGNILSARKLRDKFDQMRLKMKEQTKPTQPAYVITTPTPTPPKYDPDEFAPRGGTMPDNLKNVLLGKAV